MSNIPEFQARGQFKIVNQNKWKSLGAASVSSPAKPRQPSPTRRIPTAAFSAIDDVHTQLVGPKLTFAHIDRVRAKANLLTQQRRCCSHLIEKVPYRTGRVENMFRFESFHLKIMR